MKIAITGATGFLGRYLVNFFLTIPGVHIVAFIRKGGNSPFEKAESLSVVESDFSENELKKQLAGVDQIIHLAGRRMPRSAGYVPFDYFYESNVRLLENISRSATAVEVKRMVFASTIAVYGMQGGVEPITEQAFPAPVNNYGLSKLVGEHLLEQFHLNTGIETVSLRFSQILGPGEREDLIVGNFTRKCTMGESIEINHGGLQGRDYLYVADVAAAFKAVFESDYLHGIFNVGSGNPVNAHEIALTIKKELQSSSPIRYPGNKPGNVSNIFLNNEKINRTLGWKPLWNMPEIIHDLIGRGRE